jgi:hypothetical protein
MAYLSGDSVAGFTETSVSMRTGSSITLYDERGIIIGTTSAGRTFAQPFFFRKSGKQRGTSNRSGPPARRGDWAQTSPPHGVNGRWAAPALFFLGGEAVSYFFLSPYVAEVTGISRGTADIATLMVIGCALALIWRFRRILAMAFAVLLFILFIVLLVVIGVSIVKG